MGYIASECKPKQNLNAVITQGRNRTIRGRISNTYIVCNYNIYRNIDSFKPDSLLIVSAAAVQHAKVVEGKTVTVLRECGGMVVGIIKVDKEIMIKDIPTFW